jgi:hypothetical protein
VVRGECPGVEGVPREIWGTGAGHPSSAGNVSQRPPVLGKPEVDRPRRRNSGDTLRNRRDFLALFSASAAMRAQPAIRAAEALILSGGLEIAMA